MTLDLSRLVHSVAQQGFAELGKTGLRGQRDEGLVCPLINPQLSGSDDLNVSWGRIRPGQHHLRHHHPDASEFYVVIGGEPLIHLGDQDFRARPGDAVYIPKSVVHGLTNDTGQDVDLVVGMSVAENWTFIPDE
ncbi:cupin domain-containing protein [Amycolatopsis orientalis]|uniref:cupin domain-containing protein n=1 Tax=Amycolatopsis orientalis TaxID=31958 RepID=UPI00039D02F0|nr:cupin domain-containing protein [Amycolatopsis orientalis]